MKTKIAIVLTIFIVAWLALSYRAVSKEEQGRILVANAYYGDILAVKEAVENGAPLDYEFYFSDAERQYKGVWFNALHAAASGGNEDVINFLLDQGFNINTSTPDGWTPLFIATRDGQAEAAKLLIYRGADLNTATDLGATPLLMVLTQSFASDKDQFDLLLYMLRRGANPNQTDAKNFSPLAYTISINRPDLAEQLLEYEADPLHPSVQKALDYLHTQADQDSKKITALLNKAVKKSAMKQQIKES